jgi:glucosamine--fructose-6-phosphate aminotransferase (isomerizing)
MLRFVRNSKTLIKNSNSLLLKNINSSSLSLKNNYQSNNNYNNNNGNSKSNKNSSIFTSFPVMAIMIISLLASKKPAENCGIVGVIGGSKEGDSSEFLMQGLTILRNRGYDSAGVATLAPDGSALTVSKVNCFIIYIKFIYLNYLYYLYLVC